MARSFRTFLRSSMLGAVLAAIAGLALGSDKQLKALMDMDLEQLGKVTIISAARHEQNRMDSPRSVSIITAEEIRRRNFRTVPEAIAGLTGVFLQQSNYAGGSPIIRGMVGNRILIMVNGVRLNNATYRLGPNQYLTFIDINRVERIEVLRGAGSVLYGSDAFGGVINVITEQAPNPTIGSEFGGSVHTRFGSADRSGSGNVQFSGAMGKLGIQGGYTQEGFGDLRSDRGVQPYTGYTQQAGDAQLRYSLGTGRFLAVSVARLRQRDVPRTDLLRAGSDLEYRWAPEGLDLIQLQYVQGNLGRFADEFQITTGYQRPIESLNRIVASDPFTERHQLDEVQTGMFGVQFTKRIGYRNTLTYGAETTSDWIDSRRTDVNLRTGQGVAAKGNYADGGTSNIASVFLQDEIEIASRLRAVLGMRRDWMRLRAHIYDPATSNIDVHSSPAATTGSAYASYDLTSSLSAVAGVSQAFRAPNMDDSTVVGGSSGKFEIPNPILLPEHSLNFEYGLRARIRRGTGSVVFFDDRYRDLIDRAPALLNGLSFVDANGNGVKDSKELDVYQRQNIGRALVRGIEAESMLSLAPGWTWTNTATWTRGSDTVAHVPLTRIPPLNGVSRITWQANPKAWVEFAGVAAQAQRRLAPGDKTDVRIGPQGTAGFVMFNLRAGLNKTPFAGLSIAWENVTNRHYRLHGSGFDRPGSGIVLGYTHAF